MHEMMLSGKGGKKVYPESGPGPQSAVGDDDVAYFGEVSNAELFTAAQLAAQIPELGGVPVNDDSVAWLKFLFYGRILFIKKLPNFRTTGANAPTSWNGLYKAGMIYGEDGPGTYDAGIPVTQLRFVDKNPYRFKVRTITGDTNPLTTIPPAAQAIDNSATRRISMYTELLYRVTTDVFTAYPEEKFAANNWSVVVGGNEICRELLINGTYPNGTVLSRGNVVGSIPRSGGYVLGTYGKTSGMSYRPVLELVPSTAVFTLRLLNIGVNGPLKGPVAFEKPSLSEPSPASGDLIRPTNVNPSRDRIKPIATTTVVPTSDVTRPSNFVPTTYTVGQVNVSGATFTP